MFLISGFLISGLYCNYFDILCLCFKVYPNERHGIRSPEAGEHYKTLMLNFLKHNLWLGKLSQNLVLGNCHSTQLVVGKLSHNTTCDVEIVTQHNLLLGKLSHNTTCCWGNCHTTQLVIWKFPHKKVINCDWDIVTQPLLMLLNIYGHVFYFVCVKIGYVLLEFGRWDFYKVKMNVKCKVISICFVLKTNSLWLIVSL